MMVGDALEVTELSEDSSFIIDRPSLKRKIKREVTRSPRIPCKRSPAASTREAVDGTFQVPHDYGLS